MGSQSDPDILIEMEQECAISLCFSGSVDVSNVAFVWICQLGDADRLANGWETRVGSG